MEVVKGKEKAQTKNRTIRCIGCGKTSKLKHINVSHPDDTFGYCDQCIKFLRGEP